MVYFCLIVALLAFVDAQDCYADDFFAGGEGSSFSLGPSVFLDYSTSEVSQGSGSESVLSLVFDVPARYLDTDAIAITFHDSADVGSGVEASCFSNRDGNTDCPTTDSSIWSEADGATCMKTLTGALNFQDLVLNSHHDGELIYIDTNERVLSSTGVNTPTWDIYLMAHVETWAATTAQSDLTGAGDLDTSVIVGDGLDGDHLSLSGDLYQSYLIPFVVSWPQEIELDTEAGSVGPVITSGRLVTLSAIITQSVLPIDFSPTGAYATAELTIQTVVQHPFVLRDDSDSDAAAQLTQTDGANWSDMTWGSNSGDCSTNNAGDYCTQLWNFVITPNSCDISGSFSLEFWARCENTNDCPLEENFETTSNTYSGVLDFTIVAQQFCPEVVDEISVSGTITKYIDVDFTTEVDDTNKVYNNDFVYIKTQFTTNSAQTADGETDDDSIISFVRAYSIDMAVVMDSEPLQFDVDTSGNDVTYNSDPLDYSVNLCSADPFDPLSGDTDAAACYNSNNNLAVNYMDFFQITDNCEDDEVCFGVRIDDRVIPTDLLNTPVDITLSMLVEVYYYGVDGNPSIVRRLLRRGLQQTRSENVQVSDVFTVQKPGVSYCNLNPSLVYAGFLLDVVHDNLEVPTEQTVENNMMETRYEIARHLGLENNIDAVRLYRIDSCEDGDCTELSGRRRLLTTARYYVDIQDQEAAAKLQQDIYSSQEVIEGAVIRDMTVDHCDSDLMNLMNAYRIDNGFTDIYVPPTDDSVAGYTLGLLLSLFVLFY